MDGDYRQDQQHLYAEMKKTKYPRGSGFLKPKKKKPVEDAESGYSSQYARILGALGEGPSEGPIGGLKGVFFGEVPVENSDGTRNFQGVSYDFRPGTSNQLPIVGFGDDISSETAVSSASDIKFNLPKTQSINNANLDLIVLRLAFQLQELPPEGGVKQLSVEFRISIREGLGPFVVRHQQVVKARWSSPVELDFGFNVNNFGGSVSNFAVRVERLTPQDTDTGRYQRVIGWKAYSEVIGAKLSYPFSTLVGLGFDAAQFEGSLPEIAFKQGGRLINIPSNATVASDRGLDYSGVWNGNFVQAPIACACPAWILYDLMTNKRYGLGRYLKQENVSKWAFYELSKYCNEFITVPGSGGGYGGNYERRYQCNVVIENKEEASRVIESFRSIFRGFAYWMDNALHIDCDRPKTASMIFTQSDVEDGMFNYGRTPLKSRHTVARVTWINPENFYKQEVETVEDPIGIELYGIRELDLSAFGCITRTQAHRAGWAAILSERLELETVRFRVRPYGAYALPGKVIKVMDAQDAEVRFGGLVANADRNTVVLDSPITLQSDYYTLTTMSPSGQLVEKSVTPRGEWGLVDKVGVQSPFALADVPQPESPWILSTESIRPELYQVLSVSRVAGENGLLYEIAAIQYDPAKYEKIETDYYIPPAPIVPLPSAIVPPPINLAVTLTPSTTQYWFSATWSRPPVGGDFVVGYIVEYKSPIGDWEGRQQVSVNTASWLVPDTDEYTVRVASIDILQNTSIWVELSRSGIVNINYDFSDRHSSLTLALLF